MKRIDAKFAALTAREHAAFVSYIMAGDPDPATSFEVLRGLPRAGVDIIELGFPFTDPMADGPIIQLAGQRALKAGMTLPGTLDMVARFREIDNETPVVLMGYFNPVHNHGVDRFLKDAAAAGVDGLIIVDLPPEEDDELCLPAMAAGLDFIRLATPTTDDRRLPKVIENTSGFIYYVSITGITGAAPANAGAIAEDVARIRGAGMLPVCVGFGIKDAATASNVAAIADGAVVGSAIVQRMANGESPANVLDFVRTLADGAHGKAA